jgi:hypothetical protein
MYLNKFEVFPIEHSVSNTSSRLPFTETFRKVQGAVKSRIRLFVRERLRMAVHPGL